MHKSTDCYKFPLAAALLSAWEHAGDILGEYSAQDVLRIDCHRMRLGIFTWAETSPVMEVVL